MTPCHHATLVKTADTQRLPPPAAPSGAVTTSIKSAGTGPWHLHITDGNLLLRDGKCRATWIAPLQCLYGQQLRPWDQCGGATCSPTAKALGEDLAGWQTWGCCCRWCTAAAAGVLLLPLVYCCCHWCTAAVVERLLSALPQLFSAALPF